MSIDLLEDAAAALGELTEEVVFVGAATLALWITDDAAPPLRGTADVDVVVEVATLIGFNKFEQRLREADFRDEGSMIGRFLFGPGESLLDVIPADASILGFENRWHRESLLRGVPGQHPAALLRPPISACCQIARVLATL